jgi:histidine triad (HIT) family protein
MGNTIFSKIINKEIPADIVFESENILAFKDIRPQAPVHILIIPKIEIPKVTDIQSSEHSALLGEMFDTANKLAKQMGISPAHAFTWWQTNEMASGLKLFFF